MKKTSLYKDACDKIDELNKAYTDKVQTNPEEFFNLEFKKFKDARMETFTYMQYEKCLERFD